MFFSLIVPYIQSIFGAIKTKVGLQSKKDLTVFPSASNPSLSVITIPEFQV